MSNFELAATITAVLAWILIIFLFYRWAYRRKGVLGVLLIFFLSLIGVLIILILPSDKDKN